MKLSDKERKLIFKVLLSEYTEYERARVQAINIWSSTDQLEKIFDQLDKSEEEHHDLMKRFSDIDIPERKKVNYKDYYKYKRTD